jgi:NADPH2:quinone reductase
MNAIVVREFGGPEVMKMEALPDPAPGPGQLRIRVHAAGVNPVDTYMRSGTYRRNPSLPWTPGLDYAGVVDAVGPEVTRVAPGARVYGHAVAPGFGAYASMTLADEHGVEPLPDSVSFQQGAALGVPYGTAWRALFLRAQAQPGDTVLVHGASGGVGVAAVQIARAHGLQVIGTAGTPAGLQLVREQGAHHALNHHDANYLDAVMDLTGSRGVDVVVEMLANVNLDRDLDVLAHGGRVAVIGNRGRIEIDPRKVMARDAAIVGMVMFNTPPEELRRIHAGLVAGLENGSLRPVIGREFPLAEAPKAHTAVLEAGAHGKLVLVAG